MLLKPGTRCTSASALARMVRQRDHSDGLTVLSSADRVPPRAGRADARTHEAQAAEAAGQRTARGRLLRRVGPPVQLPLVQKMRERHEWQCTAFGRWTLARDAERCSATRTK